MDCNLGTNGKTGIGEIDHRNHDEELIELDFFDEDSPHQNTDSGENVLDSETTDRDASTMTLIRRGGATRLTLIFLCN